MYQLLKRLGLVCMSTNNNGVPWITTHCRRCNKPLKMDKSRELGYGPTCLRKVIAEEKEKQMDLTEFLEAVNEFVDRGGKMTFKANRD